MRVCASQLEVGSERYWRTEFPFFQQVCSHGCATCKPAVMRLLNRADASESQHHTYYGAAWVALARVLLTTELLRACGT